MFWLKINYKEWKEKRFYNKDKIILMNNGRISERGTHEQLIKQNGRYKVLFEQQGIAEGL